MIFSHYYKRLIIILVDFSILSISLYCAISLRKLALPNLDDYLALFHPFLIIFFASLIIFYMYGLYEKITIKIYNELNQRIVASQSFAAVIGILTFYTLPCFSVAPKTLLIFYVVISSFLIFLWRKNIRFFMRKRSDRRILMVAEGQEMHEVISELENNKIISVSEMDAIDLAHCSDIDLFTKIKSKIKEKNMNVLVINIQHSRTKDSMPFFYDLLLENIKIINFSDFYEEIFERIPLENIDVGWFFNNLYFKENKLYDNAKRLTDLMLVTPFFIISLFFYPVVWLILKCQDNGSLFFASERVGKNNKIFKMYKFRSMTDIKHKEIDVINKNEIARITKFGNFMRNTRIDELPQLINVIKGELSLIGPRPEFPKLVKEYSDQIPFYDIRHTVIPGLSGFAQIHQDKETVPKFGLNEDSTNGTKIKLSYDIYYLKHRSFSMDLSLIIKTIKILISKTGV